MAEPELRNGDYGIFSCQSSVTCSEVLILFQQCWHMLEGRYMHSRQGVHWWQQGVCCQRWRHGWKGTEAKVTTHRSMTRNLQAFPPLLPRILCFNEIRGLCSLSQSHCHPAPPPRSDDATYLFQQVLAFIPFYTQRGGDGSKSLASQISEVVLCHLFFLIFTWAEPQKRNIKCLKPL